MPFLSKIFKELLLNRIRQHLQTKSTISMHQFGFREKHGTIEQVTIEAKRLGYATHLKNGSNAPQFFCVSPRLFKILFPQNIHAITESYLQQKSFAVRYKDFLSEYHPIKDDVPQGSVLGRCISFARNTEPSNK